MHQVVIQAARYTSGGNINRAASLIMRYRKWVYTAVVKTRLKMKVAMKAVRQISLDTNSPTIHS